ncbi:MAG: YihY/virulence factor BrkB family protein [Sphaerochaeta sp.]
MQNPKELKELKETRKKNRFSILVFVKSFIEQYNYDSALMLSNGMVYSTLISVVPCVTVIYFVLNLMNMLDPVAVFLEEMLMETFGETAGANLAGYLKIFTGNAMGLGIVSILFFALTFVLLIDKIHIVVNKIYHTPKSGMMPLRYLKYLAVIIVGLFSIIFSVFFVGRFNSLFVKLRGLPALSGIQEFFKFITPLAMTFGVLLAIICLVPNCKVRLLSGVIGAASGTAGLTVLTKVFKLVVTKSVGYSVIYGSLAALMLFFLFLSFLWRIVFSSVIISYVHQCRTTGVEYKL